MIVWAYYLLQGRLWLAPDNADMRQIASLLGEINAIADDKFIWNVKTHPIDMDVNLAA